jgi:AmmeMemoRadiSam system protein B/AmmeMemoRadiSam system protein A
MEKIKYYLKLFGFLLIFISVMQEESYSRQPAVAGQFYPAESTELKNTIKSYFDKIKDLPQPEGEILGLISPHAGYIFSGQVAAYTYKFLSQYKLDNPIVILIGQSHYFYLSKATLYSKDSFLTPLGEVKLEKNLITELLKNKDLFIDDPQAHLPEHSLEVQLPFLQYIYSNNFTIVPILVSRFDYDKSFRVASVISETIKNYKTKRKIIVICSTDMSHYPKYDDAVKIDNQAIELVKKYDPKKYFDEIPKLEQTKMANLHCVFCGETAVGITMITTKLFGGDKVLVLKYANSGDVQLYSDKSRVVGYTSIAFIKSVSIKEGQKSMKETEFKISEENQKILLSLARKAIEEYLKTGKVLEYKTDNKELLTPSAVFVTLTERGQLRGCIGTTFPQYPLYQAVINMAIAAATEDPRFPPVNLDELKDIKIEISILSPLKRVFSYKDIKEKVHGVVVRREGRSGLFLPQVWEQIPKKEEFLSQLCWSKAGLPPNAWQDPKTELYVFTVFAFEEE